MPQNQSLEEMPIFKNALTLLGGVWDQVLGSNQVTLNHMTPWSLGPMVKKPHTSLPQQNADPRIMEPSTDTKKKLKEWREPNRKIQTCSRQESKPTEKSKEPSMPIEVRRNPKEFSNKLNQKIWWRRERSYDKAWNQEYHSRPKPSKPSW